MVSSKELIRLARRWQMATAINTKTISFGRTKSKGSSGESSEASVAQKGHFVVYTTDSRRFMIPLSYLNNEVVRELFKAAEEEFGIPREGSIILPIDASAMEYIISLIKRGLDIDQEKALLTSFTRCSCSTVDRERACLQLYICS